MAKKYNRLGAAIRLALSGVVAGGVVISGVSLAAEEDAVKLEKERVTGSHIKRIDVEGATPVFVIKADDIKQQGFLSVQEVLDALPQNLGGSVDASFTFGFTPGASSVDLRGFGNGRTLVLVDGKRLPIYPVGLSGTDNFVDLSQIPLVIVDRIEVLTDGASAIYGADAVSGVINIITRKDYDGMEASVAYGDTTNGGYEHNRVQFVGGVTNATSNVTFMVEHWENDPIWAKDRSYAESDVANPRGFYSIGGSSFIRYDTLEIIQDPNCGTPNDSLGGRGIPNQNIPVVTLDDVWCGFNRSAYRMLWADVERNAAVGRVNHEFNDNLSMFFSAGFTRKEVHTELEPNFYGGDAFGPYPPDNAIIPGVYGYVYPGAPNDPSAALGNPYGGSFIRRLVEWGPRESNITEDIIATSLGFNGAFSNDWEWEANVAYNKVDFHDESPNIILSVLNSYIDSGELDLFQPVPQEIVDATRYTQVRDAYSENTLANFLLSGDTPWELRGGAVSFAALTDWTRERYNDESDPISTLGDNFDGASSGGGERDHYGLGAEFLFPILENWEVNLAGRFDSYDDDSDVGSAFSPKISTAYRPIDTVLLRASWGKSFRAPDMQRLFGAQTTAFDTVNDPVTGLQVPSVELHIGGNVELEEETGENINLGIVWEALDNLTLKLDWYNIELEDIVSEPSAQFILNSCGPNQDGPFCDLIHRDAQGTLNGGYIELGAQNLSRQEITGIDFTVEYDLDIGEWGDLNFTGILAYVDSLKTKLDDTSPTVENIGLASIPEYRFGGVVDWNMGNWGASLRVDWVDEMCGVNGFECTSDEFIDDYTLWNGTVRYDAGDWGRVQLGVHNIFDEDPADDPTNNQWPWFYNNGGYSNPLGRTWTVEYAVDF